MSEPAPLRILLVEDEPSIAESLRFALERDGFAVDWCRLAGEGLARFAALPADFVVLDVGLPDGNGFDVCRALRARSDVPVLFLTARGDEVDRIVGLEIGADDYVVKPFSPREVAARVRTILRRSRATSPAPAAAAAPATGGFVIDAERLRASWRGIALPLTRSEFVLLSTLHAAHGRVCTRARLLDALGDAAEDTGERTIDSHIRSLRGKLRQVAEEDPVETHRGTGYSLRIG